MNFKEKLKTIKEKLKNIDKEKIKNIDKQTILNNIENLKSKFQNINKDNIKKGVNKVKEDKKYLFITLSVILSILFIFVVFFSFRLYFEITELNKKTSNLKELSIYNIDDNSLGDIDKISQLVEEFDKVEGEKKEINDYFSKLQSPYTNFMENIYLPSLNIWQDPYSKEIDTSIMGSSFLEKNKYLDTNLLQKWSNFFRDVGQNLDYNNITDITIEDIQYTDEEDYFKIPITVKFNSPSRRSFLMLVSKLSLTSNKKNVLLINEFMYNLWNQIKDNYNNSNILSGDNKNKIIGKHFYKWVNKDNFENKFLKGDDGEKVIYDTIKSTIGCDDEGYSKKKCYYEFRKKYSNIPSLAYKIGVSNINDKSLNLRSFLKDMPPLINISKFTFRKSDDSLKNNEQVGAYVGEVSIEVFGKRISNDGLNNIKKTLGNKCFNEKQLSMNNVLNKVNSKIQYSQGEQMSSSDKRAYINLKEKLEKINESFSDYSNYKKVIKYFEIYRMFKVNSLCANK